MSSATPRKSMSPKRRHHIFTEHCTAHNIAPCCLCGKPIHRHRDKWRIEHIVALGLTGKDTNPNCGPAHLACALSKDKQDARLIAKAKRVQARHEGKKRPRGFWKPPGAVYDWRKGRYVFVTKAARSSTTDR